MTPILGTIASSYQSASGAKGLFFIKTVTLSTPGSVSITGISGYDDILLYVSARSAVGTSDANMTFNTVTTSTYDEKLFYSTSTAYAAEGQTNYGSFFRAGYTAFNTAETGFFGNATIYMSNYASTTTYKTMQIWGAGRYSGTADIQNAIAIGEWKSNSAITSIEYKGDGGSNLETGTTIWVYGIKR